MKFLVTGARAPSALEVGRQLKRHGAEIYMGDCTAFALSRFSNNINGYLQFAAPRFRFDQFQRQILAFVQQENINIVIPTCEEVFYLSQVKAKLSSEVFFL